MTPSFGRLASLTLLIASTGFAEQGHKTLEISGAAGWGQLMTTVNGVNDKYLMVRPLDLRLNVPIASRLDIGGVASVGSFNSMTSSGFQFDLALSARALLTPPSRWAGIRLGILLGILLGLASQHGSLTGSSCAWSFSGNCSEDPSLNTARQGHFAAGALGGAELQLFAGGFFVGLGANLRTMPVDSLEGVNAGWINSEGVVRIGGTIPL